MKMDEERQAQIEPNTNKEPLESNPMILENHHWTLNNTPCSFRKDNTDFPLKKSGRNRRCY